MVAYPKFTKTEKRGEPTAFMVPRVGERFRVFSAALPYAT